MKKIFFAAFAILSSFALTSCDEDYNEGLMPPMTSPAETPQTVAFGNGAVTEVATIDLAQVTGDVVKLCNITAPTVSDPNATLVGYTLTIGENVLNLSEAGEASVEEITAIVEGLYGKRPVERVVEGVVRCYYANNGQNIVTVSDPIKIKLIPQAPEIEQAYYFTGSINGWDNTDKTYKLTNDGSDAYENPTFTLRIPAPEDGSNIEFKMTPESGLGGDWSKCLAAGEGEGKFVYNNAGGNLVITAVEGAVFYDLTFNMLDQTWSATALLIDIEPAYYLTGSINGWDNTNTDYKLTNDGSDPYANPTFTCRIPAAVDDEGNAIDIAFKMTPESGLGGDWSKCLAGGATEGTFVYNNGGGNLVITAVEGAKYYDLTFNMMELTWSYKAITFNEFIYEIGNETGWSTAHALRSSADYDGKYQGYYYLDGEFKFKPNADNWDGDWENDGEGKIADNGGSNMPGVAAGFYRIDVDLAAMTYAVKNIEYVSIIGTANGNWDTDTDLTYNKDEGCWEVTTTLNAGEMKFRGNHNWDGDVDLGGSFDNLVHGGSNIAVEAGTYNIKLYISYAGNHKAVVTKQ